MQTNLYESVKSGFGKVKKFAGVAMLATALSAGLIACQQPLKEGEIYEKVYEPART